MDKQLSKKDQQKLMQALEKAKAVTRKMKEQQELKRWAAIEVPLTLEAGFAKLTKSDLSDIRIHWNVEGASALKKYDLIVALKQQVSDKLPTLLKDLDETRYKIMKQLADRGGHGFVPMESHQLDYFRRRGLIFSGIYKGKLTAAMPQEVLESFERIDDSSFRDTIRRNTEWIKLTHGLLFYYGTLSLGELESHLESHTGKKPRLSDYLRILEESMPFYMTINHDSTGFSNIRVWDSKRVKAEHAQRPDLPFYPCTKAQLLQAGAPDYIDRNSSYRAFVDFIVKHYTISREKADSLVEECVYAIHIGEKPENMLQFLQMELEIADLETMNAFMAHISALHNNTRQWFIKGYTPDELFEARNKTKTATAHFPAKAAVIDFATRKTVGRNDPCPCGSGKKFKKCCGG
jgi:hypothetical protein